MKKHALLALLVMLAVCVFAVGTALAKAGDITAEMEISPAEITGPGKVKLTISVSNTGETDMTSPVTLYSSDQKVVEDFGDQGKVTLKSGEVKTWTGSYDVTAETIAEGRIVYYLMGENGENNQPIIGTFTTPETASGVQVSRTVSPSVAREGQEVKIVYTITNHEAETLTEVILQENKAIKKAVQNLPDLPSGKTVEIAITAKMGTVDLTSEATISYKIAGAKKAKKITVEKQTVRYGEPALTASLSSSAKGVVENGTVTLELTLKNTGTVGYSDIRVTDPLLGDVFSGQEVAAGKTLTLSKEITIPQTAEYCFTVEGTDETGGNLTVSTDPVTVTAVDPADVLVLNVTVDADKTDVRETPPVVRFTITVENTSKVDAKKVSIKHGDTAVYTIGDLNAGQSKTIERDFLLSMQGKFEFTVTAIDPLENKQSFVSNPIRISISAPTPTPIAPVETPRPTDMPPFVAYTVPPVSDPSIAPGAKRIASIAGTAEVICIVLAVAAAALLVVAAVKRAMRKAASEKAVDLLQLSNRRNYEERSEDDGLDEEEQISSEETDFYDDDPLSVLRVSPITDNDEEDDAELPHMKYVRGAMDAVNPQDDDVFPSDEMEGDSNREAFLGLTRDELPADEPEESLYTQEYTTGRRARRNRADHQ